MTGRWDGADGAGIGRVATWEPHRVASWNEVFVAESLTVQKVGLGASLNAHSEAREKEVVTEYCSQILKLYCPRSAGCLLSHKTSEDREMPVLALRIHHHDAGL